MIVFTYTIDELINNVQIISMYRANAILQHSSQDVIIPLDDTAVTSEDNAILLNYLKKGVSQIASVLSGYSTGLYDAEGILYLPLEYIAADEEVVPQVILRIAMPNTFNNTLAIPIDQAIQDALEAYMLYRLFKSKGHNYESYFDDYKLSISNILAYINHRLTTTTRSMKLI